MNVPKIDYPKPDGVITFDRLVDRLLSSTNHEEDQPCHLQLKDAGVPLSVNLAKFDAPEQRFCPAGVHEILGQEDGQPACRSMRKLCPARPATSRTHQNINWVCRKAVAKDRPTPTCSRNDPICPSSRQDGGNFWLIGL